MTGLALWQQVVVAAAGGLGAALPVAIAGWWLFRRQERIRWQEALQGDLAKVRQAAVVRVVEQLGRLELARHDWLADRAEHDRAPTADAAAALAESRDALEKAAVEAVAAFSASLYLLPPDLARAVSDAGEALASTERGEIRPILDRLAAVLEPYLPELPRRE
ncbi:MAG TPA: hypothetical protein VFL83_13820 [Anaeromyxobacter sp.]|nr:hypothetical protein [Anaeromyxobacter sp.]